MSKVLVQREDGLIEARELRELLEEVYIPQKEIIFFDDFKEYSKEKWEDYFVTWNVRHLQANGDLCWKENVKDLTYSIKPDGIHLYAVKKIKNGLPYMGGMLSTEKSCHFYPGTRIDAVLKIIRNTAGGHISVWCVHPIADRWPPEIDILEHIGSNLHAPNGPVDLMFFNAIGSNKDIQWDSVPKGFFQEFHKYSWIWTKEEMIWLVDDKEYRRQPNYITEKLCLLITIELGAGGDPKGSFPGPINNSTVWPFEFVMQSVEISKI